MSIRSFRDRYGVLQRPVEPPSHSPTGEQGWPVPRDAALRGTAFGDTVVCNTLFTGLDLSHARERLSAAGVMRDVASTVFVDTETTGLAGGAGTHVFLVGIGQFVDAGFLVQQFFLRHPGEERALLAAVESELGASSCLVTYNGRSFDVPMLQTRFRMHHHDCPLPDSHLDLLHPVRAVWKHRLPSCSLGSIEREVLGVVRVDDAPGWMIPELYFSYLQTRNVESLANVFNHNRQDIVSLARITAVVHSYQTGLDTPAHPTDKLCVALLQLRLGFVKQALPAIVHELGSVLIPAQLRLRAIKDVSAVLKRQRRFVEAVEIWERGLDDPNRTVRTFAAEELAKHLEHRAGDHERALELARRAADGARLVQDHATAAAFERRAQRLEVKIRRPSYRRNRPDREVEIS